MEVSVKTFGARTFLMLKLGLLVSYVLCSSRKQDIFSCVPHFSFGQWKGFNWEECEKLQELSISPLFFLNYLFSFSYEGIRTF